MSTQDLSAATGTLDTSETGGAHAGVAVVEQPSAPGPLVIAEGRAFRSEEETLALVNLAYGVKVDEVDEVVEEPDDNQPSAEDIAAAEAAQAVADAAQAEADAQATPDITS